MNNKFGKWDKVAECLLQEADRMQAKDGGVWLNAGQCASLRAIARRITQNGVIIADEVGMGKTRIAVAVANCVIKQGGRVAIVVPPGLGYQWEEELRDGGIKNTPSILRSLWAYLAAWQEEHPSDQAPWFNKQVVVISHTFANWRLSNTSAYWRRALLPEVYALWRKKKYGSLPRYYKGNETLGDPRVRNAGRSIVDAIPETATHPGRLFLDELQAKFSWNGSLEGDYSHNANLRPLLERSVGLGLGVFDLVIIDEAHKCRGSDSGLSRLLSNVVFESKNGRRLGMTATPVELDVKQWKETLSRIGLSDSDLELVQTAASAYEKAANKVRKLWRSNQEARDGYSTIAAEFQNALAPYVLRRDKREDDSVRMFQEHSNLHFSKYRTEAQIKIDIKNLSQPWKKAVCAAEALSFVAPMADNAVAKRLRLTLGNGHGIAALLDQVKRDDKSDRKQEKYDHEQQALDGEHAAADKIIVDACDKRQERIQWWHGAIMRAFNNGGGSLYDHPAILAAVKDIEAATEAGEKVLVFGRFTIPMRALVDLLNARAMLRALHAGQPWPQTRVHGERMGVSENSEWPAVRAAHCQLQTALELDQLDEEQLNRDLQRQYNRFDSKRQSFRESLVGKLKSGFEQLTLGTNHRDIKAFEAFSTCARPESNDLNIVSRALLELLGLYQGDNINVDPLSLAQIFCELIESASDRDDPDADADGDGVIDEEESENLWNMLKARLEEEYSRTQGGFARFMYGGTSPQSRRMIQLAFNRRNSYPKVLVAQSMVGREGLNLHKACRIVVMLHPEWNPGVAEQQIGRVDRVGSHWCNAIDRDIKEGKNGDQLTRIEVRHVIFSGTYDEHNWEVLIDRWDDLRAQLHGIVVPERLADSDENSRRVIEEIARNAPNFSPLRET